MPLAPLKRPFPGFSWVLTHHTGVLDENLLQQLAWAAHTFSTVADPVQRINEYLIRNAPIPPNIRRDSGQPDIWRDYQQILSELGFIVSTRFQRHPTLTPVGLAFLDKQLSYSELIRHQVFRFQYPNGHHLSISAELAEELRGSRFDLFKRLDLLQTEAEIRVRPAVLTLRTMYELLDRGHSGMITVDELENIVMRCRTNDEAGLAAELITRRKRLSESDGLRGRKRNAQDWLKLMDLTGLFKRIDAPIALAPSVEAMDRRTELEKGCFSLSDAASYWTTDTDRRRAALSWFEYYGALDLAGEGVNPSESESFVLAGEVGSVELIDYVAPIDDPDTPPSRKVRVAAYDDELVEKQTKLHEKMCTELAALAASRGAQVQTDTRSVDLLVRHKGRSVIIECKSVTPENYRRKVRYGIGQVLEYQYRLSKQNVLVKQCMLALTAEVPDDHWAVQLLKEGLGMGCVHYRSGRITCQSSDKALSALFTDNHS